MAIASGASDRSKHDEYRRENGIRKKPKDRRQDLILETGIELFLTGMPNRPKASLTQGRDGRIIVYDNVTLSASKRSSSKLSAVDVWYVMTINNVKWFPCPTIP
jgi:hypothetical protein